MDFPKRDQIVGEQGFSFDQLEAYPQPAKFIIERLYEAFDAVAAYEGYDEDAEDQELKRGAEEVTFTFGQLRQETGCSIAEILKFILDLMTIAGELGWDILLSGDVPKGPESTVTFS